MIIDQPDPYKLVTIDGSLLEEVREVLGRLVEGVDVGPAGEQLGVAHTTWARDSLKIMVIRESHHQEYIMA